MPKYCSKDELTDWIIEKSDYLNKNHWTNMMNAQQAGFRPDGSHLQSDRIQSIAKQARNDIKKYKTELGNFKLPDDLGAVKTKVGTYLDNWDKSFYYMAKYDTSRDLDDLGAATQSYKAVDAGLSELVEMLGLEPIKRSEPPTYPQAQQQPAVRPHAVKEIIREKEVIIKIRCPYCQSLYDETLDECPQCGAKR